MGLIVTGGGHAHMSFEGNDVVQASFGHGVKAHTHTGTVVVT